MTVLLDTHVLLWWQAGGDRLSTPARRAIDAAGEALVSSLTLWEVATLHRLGRIALDRDPAVWARDLLRSGGVSTVALTPEAATWAGTLPDAFPGDPTDRMLYATARDLRIPMITKDERLHAFAASSGDVALVW